YLTVTSDGSWYFSPTVNQSKEFSLGQQGGIANLTIVNDGNIPLNFTLEYGNAKGSIDNCTSFGQVGDGGPLSCLDFTTTPLFIYVNKGSSETFEISQDVENQNPYSYVGIKINISESNGIPNENTSYVFFDIVDLPPWIPDLHIEVDGTEQSYVELYKDIEIVGWVYDDVPDPLPSGDEGVNDTSGYFNLTLPNGTVITKNAIFVRDLAGSYDKDEFNASYTPEIGGTHTLLLYAEDTAQNPHNVSNSTTFIVIGKTNMTINGSGTSIDNITAEDGKNISISVTINNSGLVNAYNVSVGGFFYNCPSCTLSLVNYSEFASGDLTINLNVSIPSAQAPGDIFLEPNITWDNPDGTSNSSIGSNLTLTVNPYMIFDVFGFESVYEADHDTAVSGHSPTSVFKIYPKGNLNTNVTLKISGDVANSSVKLSDNLSNPWIEHGDELNLSDLSVGVNKTVYMRFYVANGAFSGITNRNFSINFTNIIGVNDYSIQSTLNVSKDASYHLSSADNISIVTVANSSNQYTSLRLIHDGNVVVPFNIYTEGNITQYFNVTSSYNLDPLESYVVTLNYTAPDQNFLVNGSLIINNTDTGSYDNLTIFFNSQRLTLSVINQSLPSSILAGDELNFTTNLVYGLNNIADNTTYAVRVGGSNCSITSNYSVGNDTFISCSAPSKTDALTYDVEIDATYYTLFTDPVTRTLSSVAYYKDLSAPVVNAFTVTSVDYTDNLTIYSNISDNLAVDSVWVDVNNYDNTSFVTGLKLSDFDPVFNLSYLISTPGLYKATLFANDTTGNLVNTSEVVFTVSQNKTFSGSTNTIGYSNPKTEVLFDLAPSISGQGLTTISFTSSNLLYSKNFKTGLYDMNLTLVNYSSKVEINDVDMTKLLNHTDFIDVYGLNYNYLSSSIKGFAINGSLNDDAYVSINFTTAELDFAKLYGGVSGSATLSLIRLYKCPDWDYETVLCNSELEKVSGPPDLSKNMVTSDLVKLANPSSAYILKILPDSYAEITVPVLKINKSINHSYTETLTLEIESTGTTNLQGTSVSCIAGDVCDNFELSIDQPGTIVSSKTVDVNLTIPSYYLAGKYNGTLQVTATNSNETKNVTIEISVLSAESWEYSLTNTKNVGGNLEGEFSEVVINNTGNTNIEFNFSTNNSIIAPNVSSVTINKQSSGSIALDYNAPATIGENHISFSLYNETEALILNVTHDLVIESVVPNQSISPNDYLIINLTPRFNNGATILNGSVSTAVVNISDDACSVNSIIDNVINCTAPTLVDSGLIKSLVVTATFNGSSAKNNISLEYEDIFAPSVVNYTKESENTGLKTPVINLSDESNLTSSSVSVTSPNGTIFTPSTLISNKSVSFNLTANQIGDYIINITSVDEHNNTKSEIVYYEVYQAINFSGAVDRNSEGIQTNMTFYRPDREDVIHKVVTDSNGAYNLTDFHNRTYDLKIELGEFTLDVSNVTLDTHLDFLNIKEIDFETDDVEIVNPEGRAYDIKGYAGIANFTADSGVVQVCYNPEDLLPRSINIYDVHLLKCANFDLENMTCLGSFEDLTITARDITNTKRCFSASSAGFSAYILSEFETVNINTENIQSSSPSGGGGGGGGFKDGIGEDLFNETIAKYFSKKEPVSLDITEITRDIFVGENVRGGFKIGNDQNETLTYKVLTSGDITNFMSFEETSFTIESGKKADLVYNVVVPETAKPGTFTGDILLRTNNFEKKIPVSLRIDEVKEQKLTVELVPESKILIPGRSMNADLNLYNPAGHDLNMSLVVELYDALTQSVVYNHTSNFILDDYYTEHVTFDLSKDIRVDKNYVLRAVAEYNVAHQKFDVRSFVNVEVQYPFVLREFMGYKIWKLLVGSGLFMVLLIGILLFHSYLEKKKRYHTTVEMSQLAKPGDNSLFLGKLAESHVRNFIEMDKLTTHTIIAGSTGGGKSISAQVIAEEVLEKNRSVIVFDPTAQWSGFLRKLEDEALLKLYPDFDISKSHAKPFKGNVHIVKDARQKIDLVKYMKPGEIHVFATNQLDPSDMDMFVASTVSQIFHANLEEARTLKTLVVYDEVHRLLPKFGGSGEGFLQIERACREFRKWGVGIMLISQVLSDFVGQIKANINTEIQVRTKDEGDLDRIKMKYGDDFVRGIIKANVGTGLMANAAYNRGRPYFVTYRPIYHSVSRLSDEDLEKYATYNEKIENIEYWLEVLKEKGIDVFDYNLELNLALKKLMIGGFNMVKIYLDGLEPRIRQAFEKLGIEPPKLKIELIEEHVIKRSIDAAKKAREKHLEEEKKKEDDDGENPQSEKSADKTKVKTDSSEAEEELEKEILSEPENKQNEEAVIHVAHKPQKNDITGSNNHKSHQNNVIDTLREKSNQLNSMIESLEKKSGPMRLERSRLKVLDKDLNMLEHGLGDSASIQKKYEKLLDDLKEM
ncbi:hypothetical protein BVX95_00540, partial [archaeon D22]